MDQAQGLLGSDKVLSKPGAKGGSKGVALVYIRPAFEGQRNSFRGHVL
jgi:hypothetical protein